MKTLEKLLTTLGKSTFTRWQPVAIREGRPSGK